MAAIELDDNRILTSRGVQTDGEVIARARGRARRITVQYETLQGVEVTAETEYFREPVSVGDTIEIRYDPDDPELIQHEQWDFSRWTVALLGAMGTTFVALGTYTLWRGPPRWLIDF